MDWEVLLDVLLLSIWYWDETEEESVAIGEGVNFFCKPYKICWPLIDIAISLFPPFFLAFSSSSWSLIQYVSALIPFLIEFNS